MAYVWICTPKQHVLRINRTNCRFQQDQVEFSFSGSGIMSQFHYYKNRAGDSCPICNGADKRNACRQNKLSETVYCRSSLEPPVGWKFIGLDPHGFGKYRESSSNETSSNPNWFEQLIRRREKEPQPTLSIPDRHRQFRMVARHSGIHARHQQALAKRGWRQSQIEWSYSSHLVWSWQNEASIPAVSPQLPGVEQDGKLRKYPPALAVAIPDLNGNLLGVQLRMDKPEDNFGKYIWLSSQAVGGSGIHLPNGEIPVGIYKPETLSVTNRLYLAEGFLKPLTIAHQTGALVIGAAGANFSGSPLTFEQHIRDGIAHLQQLQALAGKSEPITIELLPDAESLYNLHILQQYHKCLELLQAWGFTATVRWWGQILKSDGDADEISLEQFEAARQLSVDEFEALTDHVWSGILLLNVLLLPYMQSQSVAQNGQVIDDSSIHLIIQNGSSNCYWKWALDWIVTYRLSEPKPVPKPESGRLDNRLSATDISQLSGDQVPEQSVLSHPNPVGWKAERDRLAQQMWKRYRAFTPDRTINMRYLKLEADCLDGIDILAIKSAMGTGKTEALKQILEIWKGGVLAIGSRNSLLLQSCERWSKSKDASDANESNDWMDFYHLHSDRAFGLIADSNSRIACCIDSLTHFQEKDFQGRLIILDEATSVLFHALTSSTLSGKRELCLLKLQQAIQYGACVIMMDGNCNNLSVSYTAQLRKSVSSLGEAADLEHPVQVVRLENTHQPTHLNIEIIRSTTSDGSRFRVSDNSPLLRQIEQTIEALKFAPANTPKAIAIISESQRVCEALDRKLARAGYRVLRVDSKTVEHEHVRQFLTHPTQYLIGEINGTSDVPDTSDHTSPGSIPKEKVEASDSADQGDLLNHTDEEDQIKPAELKAVELDITRLTHPTAINAATLSSETGTTEKRETNAIDVLILSPTAESGLDISIKGYFYKGFGIFKGILSTHSQMQFLRRVRDLTNWTIVCQEYATTQECEGSRSPFARRIMKQVVDYLEQDVQLSLNGVEDSAIEQARQEWFKRFKEESNNVHNQMYAQLIAARNYERQHTLECLITALEEGGHQVRVVEATHDSQMEQEYAKERKEIIASDARAIFNAPEITIEEAIRIRSSFSSSIEDRYAAEKAFLFARLPGVQETLIWSSELVEELLFRNRKRLLELERYWLLSNWEAALERGRQMWQHLMGQEHLPFLADIKSDVALLNAFRQLKLLELMDAQTILHQHHPIVEAIYHKCHNSKKLQIALGRAPGKQSPMGWLTRLMELIGAKRVREIAPRNKGDSREWLYRYIPPNQNEVDRVLLECIERKWMKYRPVPAQVEGADEDAATGLDLSGVKGFPLASNDHPVQQSAGVADVVGVNLTGNRSQEGDPEAENAFMLESNRLEWDAHQLEQAIETGESNVISLFGKWAPDYRSAVVAFLWELQQADPVKCDQLEQFFGTYPQLWGMCS